MTWLPLSLKFEEFEESSAPQILCDKQNLTFSKLQIGQHFEQDTVPGTVRETELVAEDQSKARGVRFEDQLYSVQLHHFVLQFYNTILKQIVNLFHMKIDHCKWLVDSRPGKICHLSLSFAERETLYNRLEIGLNL